ncbi:MAG: hypothetical protein M3Q79_01525 [bacterium]|nr:hypothetical protein [bacterium]
MGNSRQATEESLRTQLGIACNQATVEVRRGDYRKRLGDVLAGETTWLAQSGTDGEATRFTLYMAVRPVGGLAVSELGEIIVDVPGQPINIIPEIPRAIAIVENPN